MRRISVLILCAVLSNTVKLNETRKISDSFDPDAEDVIREAVSSDENPRVFEFQKDAKTPQAIQPAPVKRQRMDLRDWKIIRKPRALNEPSPNVQDYSQCGLDLESLGSDRAGNRNSTSVWPWIAALYFTDSRSSKQSRECMGSVVDRRFILTTASCLSGTRGVKKSSEVMIKLGIGNLRDPTHVREFQVRAIHVHPKYKHDGSYDYDIALLELERPIVYNRYIRPVCLPPREIPEDSHFYKSGSPGLALGLGGNSDATKKRRDEVNEVSLLIQKRDVCRDRLGEISKRVIFTDRMFCAAEVKHYTCFGDGGGPAIQSERDGKGRLLWTEVGMTSFGKGCGQEYAFFSHLHKMMPWVEAIMMAR